MKKELNFNRTELEKMLKLFSNLADETRLKIILTLIERPKTVNEIHNSIGKEKLTLSAISHQLKLLYNSDLLIYERNGKNKSYSLSNKFCWCILKNSFEHFRN
ncbi:MAG TPA: metalloregulator ArsR/SmtB family transcription factor [Candidatus Nanoarchaeia archaeon]|nr:metalloregulator ArsR/SmtB family transcription factor [Candidatus Nanoarchaeia archaeon]